MSAKKLDAAAAGMPVHAVSQASIGSDVDVFSLSSHARAREAMEFGLIASDPGFNIFVVGENRSGRMSILPWFWWSYDETQNVSTSRTSSSRATMAAGTSPPRVIATICVHGPFSDNRQASALASR